MSKIRCKHCNYNYTPKTSRIPDRCPACGKYESLIREERIDLLMDYID